MRDSVSKAGRFTWKPPEELPAKSKVNHFRNSEDDQRPPDGPKRRVRAEFHIR